jgi:hypothetical protein
MIIGTKRSGPSSGHGWSKISPRLFLLAATGIVAALGLETASAIPIDKYLTINPIRVCDDAGANCTTVNTYSSQTSKIYAQASIAPVFLPTTQINSTASLSVGSVTNVNVAGNGQSGDASTINMWFVQNMPSSSGTLYGEGYVGGNGVAINSTAVNAFNSGVGRMDTVAHEMGHNLGLGHSNFGAGGANNLMTAGSSRSIPGGIGDIAPNGANLDQLTADQVTKMRASPFVKDVPKVKVDINGSTPFDTNNFFKVTFNTGSANVFMKSMSIDLIPVNAFFDPTNNPPGLDGSPFATSSLVGLAPGDISVSGNTDGSQLLTLNFVSGTFAVGDSFSFGIDIDLLNCIDCFGAQPSELAGALFSFLFTDGFGSTAAMSGTSFLADSQDPVSVFFDPSITTPPTPPGFVPPIGILGPPDPVPGPSSISLLALGLAGLWSAWFARSRRARS